MNIQYIYNLPSKYSSLGKERSKSSRILFLIRLKSILLAYVFLVRFVCLTFASAVLYSMILRRYKDDVDGEAGGRQKGNNPNNIRTYSKDGIRVKVNRLCYYVFIKYYLT